jgi:hypothetical protein
MCFLYEWLILEVMTHWLVNEHVLGQVKVLDKVVPFDELMAAA